MTGFFSTGMASTAGSLVSGFDAVIAFSPAQIAMIVAVTSVSGGASAPINATANASVPSIEVRAGGLARVVPEAWSLLQEPFRALGGMRVSVQSEMTLLPSVSPSSGGMAFLSVSMLATASLKALSGANVTATWSISALPIVSPSVGGAISFSPGPLSFAVDPFSVRAGGRAGLYTDVQVFEFPGTAQFSTGRFESKYWVVRTEPGIQMNAPLAARGGALLSVAAPASTIELNEHGPLAREYAVQGQVILS